MGGGGGVQGQISWKHDLDITGDPKGPPSGSTVWWGFGVLTKFPTKFGAFVPKMRQNRNSKIKADS